MKYYSALKAADYIKRHRDEINKVEYGMKVDWFCTAGTIYIDGEYLFPLDAETMCISGIIGSYWDTPILRVYFKNGTCEDVECYIED